MPFKVKVTSNTTQVLARLQKEALTRAEQALMLRATEAVCPHHGQRAVINKINAGNNPQFQITACCQQMTATVRGHLTSSS